MIRHLKQLVLISLVITNYGSFSQKIFSDWIVSRGAKGWDIVNDMATDTSGNLYIIGSQQDDASRDNQRINITDKDFIARYDTAGTLVWSKQLKAGEGYASMLTITSKNEIIVFSSQYSDESTGRRKSRNNKFIVSCLGQNGNSKWNSTFQGSRLDYYSAMAEDSQTGEIFLGGYFTDTLIIEGKKYFPSGKSDAVLIRFNEEGNILGTRIFGGKGEEKISSVSIDKAGNLVVSGIFQKSIQIGNKKLGPVQEKGLYLATFSKDLECSNLSLVAQGKNLKTVQVVKTNDNLVLSGYFADNIKFAGNTLSSTGSDDIFICSLDKNLVPEWIKQLGGIKKDRVNGLLSDGKSIFLAGSFASEIKINDQLVKPVDNSTDLFICSLTTKGDFQWFRSLGGKSEEYPKGLLLSGKKYLYVTGSYRDSVKVAEKSINSNGDEDIFIARLQDCNEVKPKFGQPEYLCKNSKITLNAGNDYTVYKWDNGKSTVPTYSVDHDGKIPLELIAHNGCLLFDTVSIEYPPSDLPFIGNDTAVSDTSFLVIRPSKKYKSYLWSNDSSDAFIIVRGTDLYEGNNLIWLKTIDSYGCEGYTDMVITKRITSSVEKTNSNSYKIFPNPTNGVFTVSLTRYNGRANLKVYDVLGNQLMEKNQDIQELNSSFVVNISTFTPGVYTVLVSIQKDVITKKIILQ